MTASLNVRLARTSDVEEIARLTAHLGYEVTAAALLPRLSRILGRPDQQVWIAEVDDRAAGWLHVLLAEYIEAEPFAVIGGLVVDKDLRGSGIGRALMQHAEQWALAQGCSVVRLWSSDGRTAAHRFYERLGYTHIKTHFAFAKSLVADGQDRLSRFVPRAH